ncbi:hypothetical protein [Sinorhizobium medicae]|uniref:hypothetical protein n=1 Tax=Sinorhizobium medicae TaxID=110321 RepID=UPI002B1BDAC4|nr:hypothetical protein [Sinorhizobium medicae]
MVAHIVGFNHFCGAGNRGLGVALGVRGNTSRPEVATDGAILVEQPLARVIANP